MKKITFVLIAFSIGLIINVSAQKSYLGLEKSKEKKHPKKENIIISKGSSKLQKNVVLEEVTGTWCQWCTGGTYYGDSLSHTYDNVYVIAVHGGDDMENTDHLDGTGLTSYPNANIDRKYTEAGIGQWFGYVNTALQNSTVADVEVTNTYNSSSQSLTVDVSATFSESVSGEYRLGAVIVENGVTGPSPQYDQSNSYSGGGNGDMGGFEDLPGSVPANMIAYNHVSRHLLGGYDGEAGSLPSTINSGETHSYSFEYTIPEEWDADQVYVIAWLIEPNGDINNAAKSLYLTGSDNAKPLFISNPVTAGYVNNGYTYGIFTHDPDNSELEIVGTELPSWLTLSSTTSLGHIHNSATLSGTPTEAGSYNVTLTISDGEYDIEQSFTIVVEESTGGSWELIGEAGFTNGDVYNQDMTVAEDGTVYLITRDADILEVYKKEEGSVWESMGLNQADGFYGQIEIASDGTPYIAYNYNFSAIYVKKYNGSSWEMIGSSPTSGVQIGFALDSNDNPYIACQDGGNGYEGWAYKYDGSSWLEVGGTSYSGSGIAGVWNRALIDSEDNLYVLWGAFEYSGTYAYVSKFDGSSWSIVGDTPVGEANVDYYQTFQLDDDGNIYVAYPAGSSTHSLDAFIYDGTSWSSIGSDIAGGAVEYCDMGITDNGEPIITFVDITYNNTISAMKYNGTDWSFIGPQGFTGTGGTFPYIDVQGNTPYVAYGDVALGEKASVRAYITQEVAVINVNATEVVFDTTEVNYTSQEVITITNQGTATLEVTDIVSNNAVFTVDVNTLSIEPGNSEDVTITFAPTLVQDYEGEITISNNDPNNATLIVEVSGVGDDDTGIDELNGNEFTVYPNPAADKVYIQTNVKAEKFQLINFVGQHVIEQTITGNNTEINTSNFKPGIYIIKVFSHDNVITRKLVIE